MIRSMEITDVAITPNPVQAGGKIKISVGMKEYHTYPYDYPHDYAIKKVGNDKKRILDYPFDYKGK